MSPVVGRVPLAYPGRVPLVIYSALRLGLLAGCFALGYWAGLRTWLLLAVAVFAAWGLSYVLLAGPRDAAAVWVAERVERRRRGERHFPGGADDDAALEDALDERARAAEATPGGRPDLSTDPGTDPGTDPRMDDGPGDGYPGETASPRPSSTP